MDIPVYAYAIVSKFVFSRCFPFVTKCYIRITGNTGKIPAHPDTTDTPAFPAYHFDVQAGFMPG